MFTAIPRKVLKLEPKPELVPKPPMPSGERARQLIELLDQWETVRTSIDQVDHEDFFDRLYELIVGCKPTV